MNISIPATVAEFKSAVLALNEHMMKVVPLDSLVRREPLVFCVGSDYIAVRTNRQPTASCPESTATEINDAVQNQLKNHPMMRIDR